MLWLALSAAAENPPPQAFQHGVRATSGLQGTPLHDPGNPGTVDGCDTAASLRYVGRVFVANPGVFGSTYDPAATAMDRDLKRIDNSIPCVQFDLWIEHLPTDYAESVTGAVSNIDRTVSKMTVQRAVRDNLRQVYVSYSVTVEPLAEAGAYRVSFGDSSIAAPADLRPKGEWKIAKPIRYPTSQIARDGDEIPLLLYTHSSGPDLVDYIQVGRPDKMTKRQDVAHDAYSLDAAFVLTRSSLAINGTKVDPGNLPDTLSGEIPWVYVPGYGRYVISFSHHPGLEPAGEVSGQLLTIALDGNILRIHGAERIAAGDGVFNLYGLRDASWAPADPNDRGRFMIGIAPAIEAATAR